MQLWDEMKAWVGLSDGDEELLRALCVVAEPSFPAIAERFYATIDRFPRARGVIRDDAQVERLKRTLVRWMGDLLNGPYDDAWRSRHELIGQMHVRVGLPERYVFLAMNLVREDLLDIASTALAPSCVLPTCHALLRVIDLDLAVITSAYREAHEDLSLRTLQDVIVRNMPVTVLCLDERGRVTAATRPSARLFSGAEAEIGAHFQSFLPADLVEAADLLTLVGRSLATRREVSVPRVVLGAGAAARTFCVNVVPLDHSMARVLVHIEELTDAVQAEARAQQAEALARVGRLSANVAHEIRNPLAAISATLQVIGKSFPDDDRRRGILDKVHGQVLRLDRLVSDLLGYARPAAPTMTRIALMGVVREATLASAVDARIEGDADAVALADPACLQQILVNLLQNARDAAGPDGLIVVRVGPDAAVAVVDDGPGVAAAVLESLFEPFVTTKTRGTGLGLAISRKLAEAMGGTLSFDPSGAAPLRGAAFVVTLSAC